MVWYGMVWYGMVWYGMVWYGMEARSLRYDPDKTDITPSLNGPARVRQVGGQHWRCSVFQQYGTYGMVWCGVVWCGVVWYGMHGMICMHACMYVCM